MQAPIIDDELWTLIEPLLPQSRRRKREGRGRPRISDRAALNGLINASLRDQPNPAMSPPEQGMPRFVEA
jgi:transposase